MKTYFLLQNNPNLGYKCITHRTLFMHDKDFLLFVNFFVINNATSATVGLFCMVLGRMGI